MQQLGPIRTALFVPGNRPDRIDKACRTDADVVMSSGEFASGTDRVAASAAQYSADVIVNVQGDELLLDATSVGEALARFRDSGLELSTLRAKLTHRQDLWDPNVVKVVIDDSERALYFSRAPLPFPRSRWQANCRPRRTPPGKHCAHARRAAGSNDRSSHPRDRYSPIPLPR